MKNLICGMAAIAVMSLAVSGALAAVKRPGQISVAVKSSFSSDKEVVQQGLKEEGNQAVNTIQLILEDASCDGSVS